MIEIEDIKDEESLKAWLSDWPGENGLGEEAARAIAVVIAHRAAMRVLPLYWDWTLIEDAREGDLTALPVLRCNLILGVAAVSSTPDIKAAATTAAASDTPSSYTDAGYAAADAAADAAVYAAASAFAAYSAAYTAYTTHAAASAASSSAASAYAASSSGYTDSTAHAAYTAFWESSIRSDCRVIVGGGDVLATRLWPDHDNPFEDIWHQVKTCETGPEWSFWIKWYDDALAGNPPNWKVLEAIALIESEVWEDGAEAVNARIAEIELDHAVTAAPNAEDIRVNAQERYEAVARSTLPAPTLQDANDRIGDVIRQIRGAQAAGNQYTALIPEADLLEDVQARYGDNALRLYEVCYKVARHVGGHVADGLVPENDNLIGDVIGDLQNNSDDIYNFDDEVRKTVDARAKLRFGRLSDEEKARIAALTEAVAEQSEKKLAQELREDAKVVAQEAEPSQETAVQRYRLGSRLARIVALGGKLLKDVTAGALLLGGIESGVGVLGRIIRALLGL